MRHAGVYYVSNGPVYVRVDLTNDSFLRGSFVHLHRSHIVIAMLCRLLSSLSDDHSSKQNCLELPLTPAVRVTIFRTTRNAMPIKEDFFCANGLMTDLNCNETHHELVYSFKVIATNDRIRYQVMISEQLVCSHFHCLLQ